MASRVSVFTGYNSPILCGRLTNLLPAIGLNFAKPNRWHSACQTPVKPSLLTSVKQETFIQETKQDVGKRLALHALANDYGKDIVSSGPRFKAMSVKGPKVRLSFDHVGGGLVAEGGKLQRFEVAGEDKKFVWATAEIEGDEVVVWSDEVKEPIAVRYAWADNPEGCNLYNSESIPASPFRTDDWAGDHARQKSKTRIFQICEQVLRSRDVHQQNRISSLLQSNIPDEPVSVRRKLLPWTVGLKTNPGFQALCSGFDKA